MESLAGSNENRQFYQHQLCLGNSIGNDTPSPLEIYYSQERNVPRDVAGKGTQYQQISISLDDQTIRDNQTCLISYHGQKDINPEEVRSDFKIAFEIAASIAAGVSNFIQLQRWAAEDGGCLRLNGPHKQFSKLTRWNKHIIQGVDPFSRLKSWATQTQRPCDQEIPVFCTSAVPLSVSYFPFIYILRILVDALPRDKLAT